MRDVLRRRRRRRRKKKKKKKKTDHIGKKRDRKTEGGTVFGLCQAVFRFNLRPC